MSIAIAVRKSMCLIALLATAASAAPQGPAQAEQADEIVVTARRTGVPVWQVTSTSTTVVLVGAIDGVTKTTKWDPTALIEALREGDRVMFPAGAEVGASPFAMVGYLVKWRRQATLPKGQTLANLLPPAQFERLAELQRKGLLKPGFERKHPLHLARELQAVAEGKTKYGLNAGHFVLEAVDKYKLRMVPLAKKKAKPFAEDLFGSPPSRHVPCLTAAMALAEADPGVIEARSQAWASRRVTDVLNSPAEQPFANCWPAGAPGLTTAPELTVAIERLLAEPEVTVAVVPLRMLAASGGVLDELAAAGFDVSGPAWKASPAF